MFTFLLLSLKWLMALIILLVISISSFLKFAPTFGGRADKSSQQRILDSPHFDGKCFNNLASMHAHPTDIEDLSEEQEVSVIKNLLFPHKHKNPSKQSPLPTDSMRLDSQALQDGEFVWLGHSTVLFRTAGKTLITDPVFHHASPIPIILKPFSMSHAPTVKDLPFIDAVLISHDHYDHLDYKAIKKMKHKVGHFYVPLGVKAHLTRWGVSGDKVTEFDWYEEFSMTTDIATDGTPASDNPDNMTTNDTIRLVFTPSKHYSGRGVTNHRTSLWGSWVVQSPELSIYFSGDGGYSSEFANIGEKYGGFDIAFIEDGAYNLRWVDVHMLPEQSAQAGIDVQAKVVLPIHWGKFDLSTHEWRDPIRRIKSAMDKHNDSCAREQRIQIATPKIGQVFNLQQLPVQAWWE